MRCLFPIAALLVLALDAQAGPIRNWIQSRHQNRHTCQYESSSYQSQTVATPTGYTTTTATESTKTTVTTTDKESNDALDEVNRHRAAHGLRPFLPDPGLIRGAMAAAAYRAANRIAGHTAGGAGDFGFLPPGVWASAAGCGAWPVGTVTTQGHTWGTCCAFENWTYGGAAYVVGADGKRYMHLFVR